MTSRKTGLLLPRTSHVDNTADVRTLLLSRWTRAVSFYILAPYKFYLHAFKFKSFELAWIVSDCNQIDDSLCDLKIATVACLLLVVL